MTQAHTERAAADEALTESQLQLELEASGRAAAQAAAGQLKEALEQAQAGRAAAVQAQRMAEEGHAAVQSELRKCQHDLQEAKDELRLFKAAVKRLGIFPQDG